VRSAVDDAARRLEAAGVERPRREAMQLLARLMKTDRGGILVWGLDPLSPGTAAKFEALVVRRERREPFQYLFGEEEFCGLAFKVDRHVLVPRPETEIVVESVVSLPLDPDVRVLDVGTGSGCIATALAVLRPEWSVVALDSSSAALTVARANVERHGVQTRVELVEGDLSDLSAAGSRRFDVAGPRGPRSRAEGGAGSGPDRPRGLPFARAGCLPLAGARRFPGGRAGMAKRARCTRGDPRRRLQHRRGPPGLP